MLLYFGPKAGLKGVKILDISPPLRSLGGGNTRFTHPPFYAYDTYDITDRKTVDISYLHLL